MPRTQRTTSSPAPPPSYEKFVVKGFIRAALRNVRTGQVIMGDWHQNTITEDGFSSYIVKSIGSIAGSKYISHMQCATQTNAVNSTQTSASGEFEARKATTNTLTGTATLRCTASWATNEATQSNLGAVALYNTSSGGTMACAATFASSAKTTDQTLSVTYEWRFQSTT